MRENLEKNTHTHTHLNLFAVPWNWRSIGHQLDFGYSVCCFFPLSKQGCSWGWRLPPWVLLACWLHTQHDSPDPYWPRFVNTTSLGWGKYKVSAHPGDQPTLSPEGQEDTHRPVPLPSRDPVHTHSGDIFTNFGIKISEIRSHMPSI